jgi:hypothetical protein
MPWCDTCDTYLAPNTVDPDGTCPTCHNKVDAADMGNEPPQRAPWHFWVMVVALVLYLGWRLAEGALWVIGRF